MSIEHERKTNISVLEIEVSVLRGRAILRTILLSQGSVQEKIGNEIDRAIL
ncbi:hypothetical protein MOV66_05790 [Agrobacterium sp. SHOUNA12C]|uniref:hypothetical protein n=1 Tax=Rhizobium rhizogenes TaxID=359 RepID=UPI0012960849|nr:hypothetical protein [Rhizobium rhizogenes]MCJ9719609.1 hypothetical protein [Agrobacterium sp. BETTINA12B]MCJ9756147.1 hypothetical protein [Agrobacterium sp. SHOUNA12C]NTF58404.1 hypothetical protein [Rhizobium rhizogenes]NTF64816.1 hypothetical protein [Rhizobium rhizogenes]NTF71581.1 hypothetical protein [Rhizobium rhizogenes]